MRLGLRLNSGISMYCMHAFNVGLMSQSVIFLRIISDIEIYYKYFFDSINVVDARIFISSIEFTN
jgi:hypothetical protein